MTNVTVRAAHTYKLSVAAILLVASVSAQAWEWGPDKQSIICPKGVSGGTKECPRLLPATDLSGKPSICPPKGDACVVAPEPPRRDSSPSKGISR